MSVIGRALAAPAIERGAEVCLRYFLGRYLGEVLAQDGLARTALPDPADLVRVSDVAWQPPDQLALLLVASPGTTGDVVREADAYTATWDMTVGVMCDLGDRLDTRDAAMYYAAAAGMCLAQQGIADASRDGLWRTDQDGNGLILEGSSVLWVAERARQVSRPDQRLRVVGEARLLVTVEGARATWPAEPLPLPENPAPPDRDPLEPGERVPVSPDVTVTQDC